MTHQFAPRTGLIRSGPRGHHKKFFSLLFRIPRKTAAARNLTALKKHTQNYFKNLFNRAYYLRWPWPEARKRKPLKNQPRGRRKTPRSKPKEGVREGLTANSRST